MLTKGDLEDIQNIFRRQFSEGVVQDVAPLIDSTLSKQLKPFKRDIKKLQKTVDIMARSLDRADVNLHKRVKRLEEHVGLGPQ